MKYRTAVICLFVLTFLMFGSYKPTAAMMIYAQGKAQKITGPTQYTHPSGFKFTIPGKWEVTKESSEVLTASSPSGLVNFVFTTSSSDDFDELVDGIHKELKKTFKNYRESDVAEDEINGLKVFTLTVEGKVDNVNMSCLVFAFVNPKGRFMLVNCFIPTEYYEAQEPHLLEVLKTIAYN
jgi:hypothetical protein